MKKTPKVLTRMRLSCCWGDNLNEKELNDVVDYINGLEQEVKKQKEVIDKAIEYIEKEYYSKNTVDIESMGITTNKLLQVRNLLKEVSE